MGGRRPPSLDKAQIAYCWRLRAKGLSWAAIAKKYGLHRHTVRQLCNPEQRLRQYATHARVHAENAELRKRVLAISHLRRLAREEAEKTGEPVLKIYARWKCLSPKDFKGDPALTRVKIIEKERWRKNGGPSSGTKDPTKSPILDEYDRSTV